MYLPGRTIPQKLQSLCRRRRRYHSKKKTIANEKIMKSRRINTTVELTCSHITTYTDTTIWEIKKIFFLTLIHLFSLYVATPSRTLYYSRCSCINVNNDIKQIRTNLLIFSHRIRAQTLWRNNTVLQ